MTDDGSRIVYGTQPLAVLIEAVTRPIFAKRGPLESRLMVDWRFIAGPRIGLYSVPRKVLFPDKEQQKDGTLYVEVLNSAISAELPYAIPVLIEKIAVYVGYKAITRIKFRLRPGPVLSIQKKEVRSAPLSTEKRNVLNDVLSGIEDEELKQALYRLGEGVLREHKGDNKS